MYLNHLQQEEIFIPSEIKSFESITGIKSRRGLENVIVSNGKIVNMVSKSYGHIPNELFFHKAEQLLVDANLKYRKRTINRNDRLFAMDFIIENNNLFELKNKQDQILPMLRFKNSYDGSEKTSGHFGFFRQVCSNGLHIAQSKIAFSIRHTKNSTNFIMPELEWLFEKFMDNEFYSISNQFLQMNKAPINDEEAFVFEVLNCIKLFQYACSTENNNPSKKARMVLDTLYKESIRLGESPNLWFGYNAFNRVLHTQLKKGFSQQEKLDKALFEAIYAMV
ncbi:protein of unknown function (DUF932) [Galbibacter orientalis DSM 19592]|uniref:DUF932 domain-containing protein n=1 Tax=Galbibacter orientalis DSM 19592 TaxID=926559 RepID=I3CAR8_9FLAO|nr:DUF932 domain-containing protein [Galbibacter orientalis]EIJ40711.1 protein of unknown function (DUF932) [Galbibacter orientalis DSM 19592]